MSRNNLGDQIRDIVEDAMNSMNFSELNQQIKRTVNGALDEVRKTVGPYQEPTVKRNHSFQKQDGRKSTKQTTHYGYDVSKNRENMCQRPMVKGKPIGSVSGTLLIVFGSIGSVLFGLGALSTYLVALFTGIFTVLGPISASLFVVFVGFLFMLFKGTSIRGRVKRYRDYIRILRGKTFCSIEEMADFLGKSKKYVIADLRKMIRLGFFPEGHIDNKKTHFITTDETYEQYLASTKSYEERKKLEELKSKEKKKEEKKEKVEEPQSVDENSEVYRAIKAGREYIVQIRHANDKIPGEEISKKLDSLEEITSKIFICVEKHPEQLPEIRRFMEYYLPTTLKLVNAYKEFDSQTIKGENITSAKIEIEKTLDTINDAFARLLDSLFEDAAMEVSTDISVLNTLLAQEGLTKSDFK